MSGLTNPILPDLNQRLCLHALPDEILQQILFFLSPRDIGLSIQRVSRHLSTLGNEPLLWKYYCQSDFKYWDSKHRIKQKFAGGVGDGNWKALYIYRKEIDTQTTAILDSILISQTNRIQKFNAIAEFGYDAKDTLLRNCRCADEGEDVLARRYYATAVLDTLHRSEALAEWSKLASGEHVSLERALGSFDLFVLHDQEGDLAEISNCFDAYERQIRGEIPGIDQFSTRRKALAIAAFLRTHNLTGLSSELAYRDLRNNFIGIALHDSEHPSLPVISVAIYCAIASRFGVDARCCGMPSHIHAMVYPGPDEDLDSRPVATRGMEPEAMYLDPYRSADEVPAENLRAMLSSWGIHARDFGRWMSESTPTKLVLRTCRNILATIRDFRGQGGNSENTGHPSIRIYANPFADMDNALYAALWANYILSMSRSDANQRDFVPLLLDLFERLFPMDAFLVEKYIYPLFDTAADNGPLELHDALRVVLRADQSSKQVKTRDISASHERVKFRVGQVFRHRRYNYIAVITGWDVECSMNNEWISNNMVDALSRGRYQSFYHVLVEDTSIRYVAEENVEIIEPELPISLISLAGRFFKRWDEQKRVFVSNIEDEYPEG